MCIEVVLAKIEARRDLHSESYMTPVAFMMLLVLCNHTSRVARQASCSCEDDV